MAHITHTSCMTFWHWPLYDCCEEDCINEMHKISHSLSFSNYLSPFLSVQVYACLFSGSRLGPSLDFCFRLQQLRRVAYVLVSTFNIFLYLYLVFILGNLFMWSPVLLALVQYYIVLYIHVYIYVLHMFAFHLQKTNTHTHSHSRFTFFQSHLHNDASSSSCCCCFIARKRGM